MVDQCFLFSTLGKLPQASMWMSLCLFYCHRTGQDPDSLSQRDHSSVQAPDTRFLVGGDILLESSEEPVLRSPRCNMVCVFHLPQSYCMGGAGVFPLLRIFCTHMHPLLKFSCFLDVLLFVFFIYFWLALTRHTVGRILFHYYAVLFPNNDFVNHTKTFQFHFINCCFKSLWYQC